MRTVTEVAPFDGSRPLPEPVGKRPRYAPDRPFPAYRYVPGSGMPHPVNDPRGHSWHDMRPPPHPEWSPHLWMMVPDWLYGFDLYNHWYFWEAHEAWEGLWQVTDKSRPPALLVQSLIQCAAAMLKVHLGSQAGASALWKGAQGRLAMVGKQHKELMGVRPAKVAKAMGKFFKPLDKGVLPSLEKGFVVLEVDV